MICLDSTTKNLQAVLAGAVSASQPQCVVTWFDEDLAGMDTKGASKETNTNNTTDVNICLAPTVQGFVRNIDSIFVHNLDTATVTINIKIDDGGTEYIICRRTLLTREGLCYEHGVGWYVMSLT